MSSLLFEIVELPNGDIALQRADAEGESLVSISFSDASDIYIPEARMTIGKVMIKAGLEALAEMAEEREQQAFYAKEDNLEMVDGRVEYTLH